MAGGGGAGMLRPGRRAVGLRQVAGMPHEPRRGREDEPRVSHGCCAECVPKWSPAHVRDTLFVQLTALITPLCSQATVTSPIRCGSNISCGHSARWG